MRLRQAHELPLRASKHVASVVKACTALPWSVKALWREQWSLDTSQMDGCWKSDVFLGESLGLEASFVLRVRQMLCKGGLAVRFGRFGSDLPGYRMIVPASCVPANGTVDELRAARLALDTHVLVTGLFRRVKRGSAIRDRRSEQLLAAARPSQPPCESEQLLAAQGVLPLTGPAESDEQLLADAASNCSPPYRVVTTAEEEQTKHIPRASVSGDDSHLFGSPQGKAAEAFADANERHHDDDPAAIRSIVRAQFADDQAGAA